MERKANILIVDDENVVRDSLGKWFEEEGYIVDTATSARDALLKLPNQRWDLALVDIKMPGMDGFDTCRSIRGASTVPVIMATARSDTHDVVAGLEAGADDYVSKPFETKELAARIRSLLRRARTTATPGTDRYQFGDVELVPNAAVVRRNGERVALTKTEFRLFCELAEHAGMVLSREQLLERVWGYDYFGDSRLVDVHIRRLRMKIEPDPGNPTYLVTVRGAGYKLVL